MLNFPIPYPNELLYSTIARAGIRHGITSPKQLLDEVFEGNRRVIATLDLPSHLSSVLQQLPASFSLEALAYRHTLFPLYAPFIPENRRQRCFQWMAKHSQGSIHLAMGVAASIVKTPRHIRYCPACLKEQRQQYGEYFWERSWQAPGVACCSRHGMLLSSRFVRPQAERHQYWPATPENCPLFPQKTASSKHRIIAEKVLELLACEPAQSATTDQWTQHYQGLALHAGLTRGKSQIHHEVVLERLLEFWGADFLQSIGLPMSADDHCWLRGIFRKHRKSFSYLQHVVVHAALKEGDEWKMTDVLKHIRSLPEGQKPINKAKSKLGPRQESADQAAWLTLLATKTAKKARQTDPALYARLYRAHKDWLLSANRALKQPILTDRRPKINWELRDNNYLQRLQQISEFVLASNDGPRRSRSFWLKRLGGPSTIEKKLSQLPKSKLFLNENSETVPAFQIRRLKNTYEQLRKLMKYPPRWRLLRRSGLSEQRLTPLARAFLEKLEREQDEQTSSENQRYSR